MQVSDTPAEMTAKLFQTLEGSAGSIHKNFPKLSKISLELLQEGLDFFKTERASLRKEKEAPKTFWKDPGLYGWVMERLWEKRIALIHGNFFHPEAPDLIYAAMETFPDPLRRIYGSNALDWLNNLAFPIHDDWGIHDVYKPSEAETKKESLAPFLRLIHGPLTSPQSEILLTCHRRQPKFQYAGFTAEEVGEILQKSRDKWEFRENLFPVK